MESDSGLRATLFVIYINDLSVLVYSTIQIFSEYMKIYRTVNDIGYAIILQENTIEWSIKW